MYNCRYCMYCMWRLYYTVHTVLLCCTNSPEKCNRFFIVLYLILNPLSYFGLTYPLNNLKEWRHGKIKITMLTPLALSCRFFKFNFKLNINIFCLKKYCPTQSPFKGANLSACAQTESESACA